MTRALLLILAVVALAAAGCGSSSSSSDSTSKTSGSGSSSSKSGGGAAGAISMKNIQFSPKDANVKVGQKVTWTNDDSVQHNVTATAGASFKSQNFGQGSTFSYVARKVGTIKYTCTLHPGMNGTLTIR